MPRMLRVLAVLVLAASALRGQDSLPSSTTTRTAAMDWLRNLPIDFFEDYFLFEPGIGLAPGGVSIRGSRPASSATYLDATPIDAGYRGEGQGGSLAVSLLGATGSRLLTPIPSVRRGDLTIGVPSAEFGNGEAGVLAINSIQGSGRVTAGLDYATDELWSADNSLGLNRLEVAMAGGIGARFGFALGAALRGQYSSGYGPGQRDVPLFLSDGIDTTVAIPSAIGDPFADTSYVDVLGFRENSGLQVPSSTQSDYQLLGRLDFALSERTVASFTGAAAQDQGRQFDYANLYNPPQLGARRAASHAYTFAVSHDFGKTPGKTRALELAVSIQGDLFESGPLSAEGEADSRDPAGGFLIAPLGFRFGLDEFPVNDDLVNNVLLNTPGSRRSPYDLENTAQYSLVDQFRNNAYGLLGFSEGGGPTGRLALMDEDRVVGRIALDWALDSRHTLRVGGELVNYDLANYSYNLTSQVFSDVYVEHPARQAAFVEDRITFGDAVIGVGLRYDRFETGAARVEGMPRISTNPAMDPSDPEALMTPDEAHSALSPRVQMGYRASPATDLRIGIGRQVQMPDFGLALAGITTDIALTRIDHVFAGDLGYGSTTLAEIGVTHRFSEQTTVDVSVYGKQLSGQVATRVESVLDPLTDRNVNIQRFRSDADGNVLGVDVRLEQRLGSYFRGFVGYAYQDASGEEEVTVKWSRPHTLAGAIGAALPDGWESGSWLGAILENSAAWGTFRFASGTAYTACVASPANLDVLSGESCQGGIAGEVNGQRLPATKQFDLKIARSFPVGGTRVTGYIDARNLFNFDNTTAVYAMTGEPDSPELEAQTWQGDSAAYAHEAQQNGAWSFPDGSIDLQFAGSNGNGCGNWTDQSSTPSTPNCVYLVRAEQRFGDGDGIFNLAEQQRASNALYHALNGSQLRTTPGRFIRLGIAVEL